MERREAIKRTAYLMGGVVFAPSILGVLKGCAPTDEDWSPELFNREQAALTTALAGTILPAGETPGAVEVGVPGFIEKMVKDIYTESQREDFIEGLNDFNDKSRDAFGKVFSDLTEDEQYEFANSANKNAIESEAVEGPQFFLIFKELTMIGFFTSEVGATQVLRHETVPGEYRGCIPFDEVGRTWATG